ncbi:MAG TPA: hypothetical protein VGC37_09325 [Friedmanniella sp.]
MHLLPYALRRLLHRPKRARRSTPDPVTIRDQREHELRRYRPRPSAASPRGAEREVD